MAKRLSINAFIALLLPCLSAMSLQAAEFIFINADAPGFGQNDPEPRAPVGGNPGTTLGQQRRLALEEAGRIWGRFLQSDVPIRVEVEFADLGGGFGGTTLAGASAEDFEADFSGAPEPNVFYPVALANSLAGIDLQPSRADIGVTINEALDSDASADDWYYGFDGNTPSDAVNFIDVLLHELAHGLGFVTVTSSTTGAFPFGQPDVFATRLRDLQFDGNWPELTAQERVFSSVNSPNLVWSGPSTAAAVSLILDGGGSVLRVRGPSSAAGQYAYLPALFGPQLPPGGIAGELVVVNDGVAPSADACQPILNAAAIAGNIALIERNECFFDDKTYAAQQAGAIAVIIANNVDTGIIDMAGDEVVDGVLVDITIPTIAVSLDVGERLQNASPGVQVTLGESSDTPIATNAGFLRMHAPGELQLGSSVSHWTTAAQPDLLMEPFINDELRDDLDLTLTMMRDIGWVVLDIPYPHVSLSLWQDEQFPDGVDPAPDGDPDGDGVSNAEEYFFGGDPLGADPQQLPILATQGQTELTYTRSTITTDLKPAYEVSTDLQHWDEAVTGVDLSEEFITPIGHDAERVRVQVLRDDQRLFLRLRLSSS